jgi:uncharacterized protein (TIGR02996 family)
MANEAQLWEQMGPDIVAAPHNDDLRLEFATLLEEGEDEHQRDPERAKFIYLQLASASLSSSDAEWMRLAAEAGGASCAQPACRPSNVRNQPAASLPARAWHGLRQDSLQAEAGDA